MDNKEHPAISCETLSNTAPEVQSNQHICVPTMKVDIKEETKSESRDEEESPCSDFKYPPELLETSEFVNYYDNKEYALEQLKKEFPEDECLNMELSKLIDEQQVKHENSEDGLSLLINEENVNKKNQITVKMERLKEQDILYNAEATSIHYDVLVTRRVVQCKLCGRIFKNSFSLLNHNNEHIKVEINTSEDKEMIELHHFQYYDKVFKNSDNMLAHVGDVHSQKKPKDKLCRKQLPSTMHPDGNINGTNNNKLTGKKVEKKKYKCDSCEGTYKSKGSLTLHIKRMHYDHGRTFACWCGKEFRTPIHLRIHMNRQHDGHINGTNNDKLAGNVVKKMKYKCDSCEGTFKSKDYLRSHIKNKHYDYGRMFECWCGKKFRTPHLLRTHMIHVHDGNINGTNNDKLTGKVVGEMKYKCDSCDGTYKSKYYLTQHIKRIHYNHGRTFACRCGKEFRTPQHLRTHMKKQHDGYMNITNNDKLTGKEVEKMKYKCDSCEGTYKSKHYLGIHIRDKHYDYGRTFACWCGKQFRTPHRLRTHMNQVHDGNINGTNNDKLTGKEVEKMKYKCDSCEGTFEIKQYLTRHIKRKHYDHGRTFACWCGKEFRTPIHLRVHMNRQHDDNINGTNNDKLTGKGVEKMKYKCDSCEGTYKYKVSLTRHIKMMHYDYGRTFACWCGEQFRSPLQLRDHKKRQHCGKIKDIDNNKVLSHILFID